MKNTIIIFFVLLMFATCKKDIVKKNSPLSVFEVFWQTMDERYVYFEEKKLNWDSIYNVYYPKINDNTTDEELKNYFQEIINYIKDGHVFITMDEGNFIKYKYYKYTKEKPYYNQNRWQYLHNIKYLDPSHAFMAQVRNTILYIKISSFSTEPHLEDLFFNIKKYNYQDGIIIDISNNRGGQYLYLREWSSLFFNGTETFLYRKEKTGKSHTDFSDYLPVDFDGQGYFKDSIPIAMIISGYTYSSGTFFSALMKQLPNCRVFGEPTSGGGGGRATIILPNNWLFSFTIEKLYDINKYPLEEGVLPDTVVVNEKDIVRDDGVTEMTDLVMEASINYLQTKNKNKLPMKK